MLTNRWQDIFYAKERNKEENKNYDTMMVMVMMIKNFQNLIILAFNNFIIYELEQRDKHCAKYLDYILIFDCCYVWH